MESTQKELELENLELRKETIRKGIALAWYEQRLRNWTNKVPVPLLDEELELHKDRGQLARDALARKSNMCITIVDADDWSGLYINGKLEIQGHSLSFWEVLNTLKIEFDVKEPDEEWMQDRGQLPENLKDVLVAASYSPAE